MEAVVVLQRVGFSEYFCPKLGQDFKPSTAPLLIPNHRSRIPSGFYNIRCSIMFITAVCMMFLLEGLGLMANAIWVELTSSFLFWFVTDFMIQSIAKRNWGDATAGILASPLSLPQTSLSTALHKSLCKTIPHILWVLIRRPSGILRGSLPLPRFSQRDVGRFFLL